MRCADRILKLSPDNAEALRDRGLGYFKLGHRHGARHDLGALPAPAIPDAADAGSLRERLVELSSGAAKPKLTSSARSDRHHFEVVLGHAAIRARPGVGNPPSACPVRCLPRATPSASS